MELSTRGTHRPSTPRVSECLLAEPDVDRPSQDEPVLTSYERAPSPAAGEGARSYDVSSDAECNGSTISVV